VRLSALRINQTRTTTTTKKTKKKKEKEAHHPPFPKNKTKQRTSNTRKKLSFFCFGLRLVPRVLPVVEWVFSSAFLRSFVRSFVCCSFVRLLVQATGCHTDAKRAVRNDPNPQK